MLHPLNFDGWKTTAWCVPSAVAILTGAPVGHMHVRSAFVQNIALKDVKGVFSAEALLLLKEQGYKAVPIDLISRFGETPPTIAKFFEMRTPYEYCMPVMFATVDHMMTCHMGFAADNWTKRPVPTKEFPKLKRKVCEAWIVSEHVYS